MIYLHSHERGNVLFLILIAITLFAALCYALTQSSQGGAGDISKEKAKAYASAVIQNTAAIRQGILKVRASGNCTESMLSFKNSVYKVYNGTTYLDGLPYENVNAPTNKSCHIFEPNGGSVIPTIPPTGALNMQHPHITNPGNGVLKAGHAGITMEQFSGVGTDGPAATSTDLIIRQNYFNKATCLAINDIIGVANPGGNPPVLDESATSNNAGISHSVYNLEGGNFGNSTATLKVSGLTGVLGLCYYKTSVNVYMFIDTLISR